MAIEVEFEDAAIKNTCSPDALDAIRVSPSKYGLVISDRGMPNMTGEQLARELISIRPDIPISAMKTMTSMPKPWALKVSKEARRNRRSG